jgi:hypothetical protein
MTGFLKKSTQPAGIFTCGTCSSKPWETVFRKTVKNPLKPAVRWDLACLMLKILRAGTEGVLLQAAAAGRP